MAEKDYIAAMAAFMTAQKCAKEDFNSDLIQELEKLIQDVAAIIRSNRDG